MKTSSRLLAGAVALLLLAACKEENVARQVPLVEESEERAREKLADTVGAQIENRKEIDRLSARVVEATRDNATLEHSRIELEDKLAVLEAAKRKMEEERMKLQDRWEKETKDLKGAIDQPLDESFADMVKLLDKTLRENQELKEKLEALKEKK